ncbi:MAG: hypothetical protein IJJ28_04235, partial [Lentisphaeria bacterium]|nr:hypothetical protein [Lentisphaeria bacterium]
LKNGEQVRFHHALRPPFEVNGFPWRQPDSDVLERLPDHIRPPQVEKVVMWLKKHTSGGTVRFATDSPIIVFNATFRACADFAHMTRLNEAGFDLMLDCGTTAEKHLRVIPGAGRQEIDGKEPFVRTVRIPGERKMREYTVFLPLYGGIKSLEIGVAPGSRIAAPRPQRVKLPICFYGSSITQGCSASRPANNYTTLLCRAVDAPQVNLGFSGSARGEEVMARAIAGLKLAAFVLDYDHNAYNPEHLRKTHERFFRIVREAQPTLPVIIVSGPKESDPDSRLRRDIIKATYDRAVAAGDENVYFVDGLTFFDEVPRRFATVDEVHPTDLGFYLMYRKILPVLKRALGQK